MSRRDSAERFRPTRGAGDSPPAESAEAGRRLARWPMVFAALAGAVALTLLVLRYSAVNALLQLGPEMAATISPEHPRVRLARAFEALQLTGDPSEEMEREALAAFRRAPLSEVPLLIAARRSASANDNARTDRLVAAASRRNPRSRYALLLQLDQHVRNGRGDEAAVTMAMLTRSFPDVGPLLTAQLALMAANPETRAPVRRVMALDPELRDGVLEHLARQRVDADTILDLAGPAAPRGGEAPRWLHILLDGLVERGEVARAHQVWQSVSGAQPPPGGIYDPEFAGLPGPPPFNWSFETGGNGFAERSAGGLHAEYSGRDDARLASQLLALPPGRYRLSFTAEGQARAEDGRLLFTISCHPGGPTGLQVPITGVDFSAKEFSAEFTVPASRCPGQWLRLEGRESEFPKDQQVTISRLRVERVGR